MTARDPAELAADIIVMAAEALVFTFFFAVVALWWIIT